MKYEFVVDCLSKIGCQKIQKIMTEDGFVCTRITDTLLGDHIGTKNFKNKSAAETLAKELLQSHSKVINQITIR